MITVEAVRAALAQVSVEGSPLPEDAVAEALTEGRWLAVVLALEAPSKTVIRQVWEGVARAFHDTVVEVRAGALIYRGGAGFGESRDVIAVLGGKGGVGKSTVAVNLALTLSAMGRQVGLLDCDLNAPDIPHMLGVHASKAASGQGIRLATPRPLPPSQWAQPEQRLGIEVMSVGFIVPERIPPRITSRLLTSTLLRGMVFETAWSADILLLDAPPGTGEEIQAIAELLPLSGALFVTTPQDLAQMDAERTLTLLREHGVPVAGLVQNMAAMTCPHCGETIDMFAKSERLSNAGVPVIGSVPFDLRLSEQVERGIPLVLAEPNGPTAYAFARIAAAVKRWLSSTAIAGA